VTLSEGDIVRAVGIPNADKKEFYQIKELRDGPSGPFAWVLSVELHKRPDGSSSWVGWQWHAFPTSALQPAELPKTRKRKE